MLFTRAIISFITRFPGSKNYVSCKFKDPELIYLTSLQLSNSALTINPTLTVDIGFLKKYKYSGWALARNQLRERNGIFECWHGNASTWKRKPPLIVIFWGVSCFLKNNQKSLKTHFRRDFPHFSIGFSDF